MYWPLRSSEIIILHWILQKSEIVLTPWILQYFSVLSYIRNCRRFHNYGSWAFLIIALVYLLRFTPTRLEKMSIIKKRSGEEVDVFWTAPFYPRSPSPTENEPGYIMSDYVKDYDSCYSVPEPMNEDCSILLLDLKNACHPQKTILKADSVGYNVIIYHNHTHTDIYNLVTGNTSHSPSIIPLSMSDEDVLRLKKFLYPGTIRFQAAFNTGSGRFLRLQPLYREWPWLMVLQTDNLKVLLQAGFYVLIIFYLWRSMFLCEDLISKMCKVLAAKWDGGLTNQKIKIIKSKRIYRKTKKCNNVKEYDFDEEDVLGYGAYAKVTKVTLRHTGEVYAMKTQHLAITQDYKEAETLARISKHNDNYVVPLVYAFVTEYHIHLVMELMKDTLEECMSQRKLTPYHFRLYTVELGLAIIALHEEFSICHRDLKPSNIMLDFKGHLKIGDFGCSLTLRKNEGCEQMQHVGTPSYMAPEGFKFKYSQASDWWSFGCIVYELFSPQHDRLVGEDWIKIFKSPDNVPQAEVTTRVTKNISDPDVQHLLSRCLTVNSEVRIRHPIDMDDLLCLGLTTIDYSEDILKEFPWNDTQQEDSEEHKEIKMLFLEAQHARNTNNYNQRRIPAAFRHYSGLFFKRE